MCDKTVWDRQELLNRVGGDEELVAEVLKDFLGSLSGIIERMDAFLEADDIDGLYHLSHKLKGTAANMSAESIRKAASILQSAAMEKKTATLPDACKALSNEIGRFLKLR